MSDTMRVLIATDIPFDYVCGSSNFIRGLGRRMLAQGHAFAVMNPSRTVRHETHQDSGITVYGIRSYPSVVQKTFRIVPPVFIKGEIRRVIREFRPDVVHVQSNFFIPQFALAVAREEGIATAGTNHFVPGNFTPYLHLPGPVERFVERIVWAHIRWLFNKCDVVTSPSRTAAGLLSASGMRKPVHAVSNGIDLSRFFPGPKNEAIRRKYHIPDGPLLVSVGRVDGEKRIDVVLRALKRVVGELDLHLLIAGRGNQEGPLKRLTHELGLERRVVFAGYVPDEDLPELYRLGDCYPNACAAELQCIAALEAMATGLPVVLADAMALPELVHEGVNGFLFPPGDDAALADRLRKVFADAATRERMGRASLEMARTHDVAHVIGEFLQLYRAAQAMHMRTS